MTVISLVHNVFNKIMFFQVLRYVTYCTHNFSKQELAIFTNLRLTRMHVSYIIKTTLCIYIYIFCTNNKSKVFLMIYKPLPQNFREIYLIHIEKRLEQCLEQCLYSTKTQFFEHFSPLNISNYSSLISFLGFQCTCKLPLFGII